MELLRRDVARVAAHLYVGRVTENSTGRAGQGSSRSSPTAPGTRPEARRRRSSETSARPMSRRFRSICATSRSGTAERRARRRRTPRRARRTPAPLPPRSGFRRRCGQGVVDGRARRRRRPEAEARTCGESSVDRRVQCSHAGPGVLEQEPRRICAVLSEGRGRASRSMPRDRRRYVVFPRTCASASLGPGPAPGPRAATPGWRRATAWPSLRGSGRSRIGDRRRLRRATRGRDDRPRTERRGRGAAHRPPGTP